MLLPQNQFPLLARFQKKFPITDRTIFAYNGNIYTNYDLPDHLIAHENKHLEQQDRIGLNEWVEKYLEDDEFRLKMELEAYRVQLREIKDRNARAYQRMLCIDDLTSPLYGNILTKEEAKKLL